MAAPVTSLYAALLAALFIVLSARVIRVRRGARVIIGTGGDRRLERAARVQANFAEYVPLAVILLLLAELAGTRGWVMHALGAALLLGRIAHAFGVSREPEDFRFRVAGVTLTMIPMTLLVLIVFAAAAGLRAG